MKRALDESERAGLEHGYRAEQAVTEVMRLEGMAAGPATEPDDEATRSVDGS